MIPQKILYNIKITDQSLFAWFYCSACFVCIIHRILMYYVYVCYFSDCSVIRILFVTFPQPSRVKYP